MYIIYLIDEDGSYIELDTEELDFGVEFKISTLEDLSIRSGTRTKEITLKGTEKNNNAFGYIYRLSRVSNLELATKLFYNANSLRPIDCLVYNDANLLFIGTLRLIAAQRVKGFIYYKAVITDAVIDVMKWTQERQLNELDVTDLKHIYSIDNITNSWSLSTQRWTGTTFSQVPFQLGSGYTYPYAYYGLTPSPTNVIDYVQNFRPALYVREIFDRIIGQPLLSGPEQHRGYSWELKSNDSKLIDKFNRLIVPNNQERMVAKSQNFKETVFRCGTYSAYDWVDYITPRSEERR